MIRLNRSVKDDKSNHIHRDHACRARNKGRQIRGSCRVHHKSGRPEVRKVFGEEEETTWYRSVLMAAVRGLKLLNRPCDVELVTDCVFIANMINRGTVEEWGRNGWRKASGEEVKMKELWKKLYCFMTIHKITAVFSKHHAYRHFLMEKEGDKKEC